MLKYVLSVVLALSCATAIEIPQTEAGPLRNLISRGVHRRQARRAEGRGFLPGRFLGQHASHGSCGTGHCGVTQRTLSSCPSCPSSAKSTVPAAPKDCPACPNGVCPKT